MNRSRNVRKFKIFILSSLFPMVWSSAAQAASLADTPASKNSLVNDLIQVILETEASSIPQLNLAAEAYVERVPESARLGVFRSLISLFDQYAVELVEGARTVLTKGRKGLQLRIASSAFGSYISYMDDERMRNIESLGSYNEMNTGNMFQHVLSRMDLLTDADFETFSKEFISSTQKARVALDRINGLLKQASIETGYANHTNTWSPHSRTLPDILLLKVFESVVQPGLANQSPLQKERILKLMNRTIGETNAMNDLKQRILVDLEKNLNLGLGDARRPPLNVRNQLIKLRVTIAGGTCQSLFSGR